MCNEHALATAVHHVEHVVLADERVPMVNDFRGSMVQQWLARQQVPGAPSGSPMRMPTPELPGTPSPARRASGGTATPPIGTPLRPIATGSNQWASPVSSPQGGPGLMSMKSRSTDRPAMHQSNLRAPSGYHQTGPMPIPGTNLPPPFSSAPQTLQQRQSSFGVGPSACPVPDQFTAAGFIAPPGFGPTIVPDFVAEVLFLLNSGAAEGNIVLKELALMLNSSVAGGEHISAEAFVGLLQEATSVVAVPAKAMDVAAMDAVLDAKRPPPIKAGSGIPGMDNGSAKPGQPGSPFPASPSAAALAAQTPQELGAAKAALLRLMVSAHNMVQSEAFRNMCARLAPISDLYDHMHDNPVVLKRRKCQEMAVLRERIMQDPEFVKVGSCAYVPDVYYT